MGRQAVFLDLKLLFKRYRLNQLSKCVSFVSVYVCLCSCVCSRMYEPEVGIGPQFLSTRLSRQSLPEPVAYPLGKTG